MRVLKGVLIDEAPLVFLDCETTGLDPFHGDRICEIAFQRVESGAVTKELVTCLNPEDREITLGSSLIHGLTPGLLAEKPRFIEIAAEVMKGLSAAVVIGHNVLFDLTFLREEFRRLGMSLSTGPAVDTRRLIERSVGRGAALYEAAHDLGIEIPSLEASTSDRPRQALTDVLILREVFERLLSRLRQQEGILRLGDLLRVARVN
ncbi:MAG: 3'-5' exonuclease [Elusimicrobia bacterium]|nr:3'-5' exonuclease [Elusimicrobiota bacterium]